MEATNEDKLRIGFDRLRCNLLNLAELIFLDVLASAPDDPMALRLLGVTRCKLGRVQEGMAWLRAASERGPTVEVVWSDLAVAQRDAADPGAEDARARAVALRDPQAPPLPPLADLTFSSERAVHPFERSSSRA